MPGATPNLAIPYPASADPITDYPALAQDLAELLELHVARRVTAAQFAALTPVDNQEVYLEVDATNGIYWHLKYRAASASAYKWEYLGGPAQASENNANDGAANTGTTWTNLVTDPGNNNMTVARAGEYEIHFGARILLPANTGANVQIGVKIGSAVPGANDFAELYNPVADGNGGSVARLLPSRTIAAGDTIKLQYRNMTASGAAIGWRWLAIRPRRVS